MAKSRYPSLFKIIIRDPRATWGTVLTIGGWILYFVNFEQDKAWIFLCIAILATAFGLLLILSRISFYQSMFAYGVKVPARVISCVDDFNRRGYWWVEYEFIYQNQKYHRKVGVRSQGDFYYPPVVASDVVTVIINPDNPEQHFIRDFFA